MCKTPKPPKVEPIPQLSLPEPAANNTTTQVSPTPDAPVLDKDKSKSRSEGKLKTSNRTGTSSLRIDLALPSVGGLPGLNIPN